MRQLWSAIGFIGFLVMVLFLTLLPQGIWSGLLVANLRSGIGTPWAVPVALGILWFAWRYAGGQWPWRRSEDRRIARRAAPVKGFAMGWALLANGFALVALAALWIILRELVKTPGNPAPDFSAYPKLVVVAVLLCAALIGSVSEEVGLRGYLQGRLERHMPWPLAVLAMALVAAPFHAATQGFVWPTMLFYLLADTVYGVTAYLTKSIVPGIVAHAAGLFVFFAVIWPADHARPAVSLGSADMSFWALVAICGVFSILTAWAFLRLSSAARAPQERKTTFGMVAPQLSGPGLQ